MWYKQINPMRRGLKLALAGILAVTALRLPAQPFTVLHTFGALTGPTNSDGDEPRGDLAQGGNVLYGTAPLGGTNSYGTVFSIHAGAAAQFFRLEAQ